MAADTELTPSGYIQHHLTFFSKPLAGEDSGFWVLNVDSLVVSILLGIVGVGFIWWVVRGATSGVPNRRQALVELLIDFVDEQAKGIFHHCDRHRFVAPLALTVFVWVVLLNTMDLLPVDLLPLLWGKVYAATGHDPEHAFLRVVPTADLSITMGLSVGVLFLVLIYNVKIKGLGGWVHELYTAPFGNVKLTANPLTWLTFVLLGVVNFAMQIVEFVSKTVSHGMRLFGNMYAGELIFLLIALLGGAFALTLGGLALALLHIVAGTGWAIFHILIISIQAYVFMMLTLVYIGQAHDAH
jgi:F-type H+-transporting ATPase subunit a